MKIKGKIAVLSALLVGTASAFSNSANVLADDGSAAVELWGAPFTEKILQEDTVDYSSVKTAAKINLDVARAETECAQIVMTTGNADATYTVSLSDLTLTSDSSVKFKADRVTAYTAQYFNISSFYSGNARPFSKGHFPDTMLPYEAAAEYGENTIEAHCNQSLYFEFDVPDDQAPGIYQGNYSVTVGGKTTNIPVTVRVRDFTVSTSVSSKSCFLDNWFYYLGEYNGSQRMLDNYHKMLMQYRLCPNVLVASSNMQQEDAEYYAQKVVELYEYGCDEELFGEGADRFTNYTIPTQPSDQNIYCNTFTMYVDEIAKVSCQKGVNFVERAVVYKVDEPEGNGAWEYTKTFDTYFRAGRIAAANSIENNRASLKSAYGVTDAFIDELVESAKNIHNLVTQGYMEKYEDRIETWCPLFDSYDSPAAVEKYNELNPDERWWYGCVIPPAPHPTYHVDDLLISPRLVGWLQAYYGVRGNLYWAVDLYAAYENDGSGYQYCYQEDYYDNVGPYANTSGEGYLFRPGKKYGIDGPIPTIRLQAIRDGLEEYELLEDIKGEYASVSEATGIICNAESTIGDMLSSMCSGMQVGGTSADFATARAQLLDLYDFTTTGVVFQDYNDDGKGTITYSVFVPNGVTLEVQNATKSGETSYASGKLVTYTVDMQTTTAAAVIFTATDSEKTVTMQRELPGKVSVYPVGDTTASEFSGTDLDSATLATNDGVTALQLKLKAVDALETRRYQRVTYRPAFMTQIGKNLSQISFNFQFLPSDKTEKLAFKICVKYKNKTSLTEEYSGELTYGNNEIVWANLNTRKWSDGAIERIDFRFGDAAGGVAIAARSDVYFTGVSLYAAKEG